MKISGGPELWWILRKVCVRIWFWLCYCSCRDRPRKFRKKIPRAKAQQKWSQAGTEVLEELELRVMYPDTDLSVPKQRIPHLRSSRAGNVWGHGMGLGAGPHTCLPSCSWEAHYKVTCQSDAVYACDVTQTHPDSSCWARLFSQAAAPGVDVLMIVLISCLGCIARCPVESFGCCRSAEEWQKVIACYKRAAAPCRRPLLYSTYRSSIGSM